MPDVPEVCGLNLKLCLQFLFYFFSNNQVPNNWHQNNPANLTHNYPVLQHATYYYSGC